MIEPQRGLYIVGQGDKIDSKNIVVAQGHTRNTLL